MQQCIGSRRPLQCSSRSACTSATAQRSAARSLMCSSRLHLTSWDSSNQSSIALQQAVPGVQCTGSNLPRRQVVRMGNKATGGPFAPLVVVVRNIVGDKEFNKLRGKAISLHSQVIKEFCGQLGVDNKQVQGVIRLAKKNGEKLGFLA